VFLSDRQMVAPLFWTDFAPGLVDHLCRQGLPGLGGPPENGGSMYQGLWWNCVERRTKKRVVELEELAGLLKFEEQPCPPKE